MSSHKSTPVQRQRLRKRNDRSSTATQRNRSGRSGPVTGSRNCRQRTHPWLRRTDAHGARGARMRNRLIQHAVSELGVRAIAIGDGTGEIKNGFTITFSGERTSLAPIRSSQARRRGSGRRCVRRQRLVVSRLGERRLPSVAESCSMWTQRARQGNVRKQKEGAAAPTLDSRSSPRASM